MGHSVTQNNRGAIPTIIDLSAGRGRGFVRINSETIQNRYKATNGNRTAVPNNPNQSLLCDGIDFPILDISKSTNHQPDKEITGNKTAVTGA